MEEMRRRATKANGPTGERNGRQGEFPVVSATVTVGPVLPPLPPPLTLPQLLAIALPLAHRDVASASVSSSIQPDPIHPLIRNARNTKRG